MLWKWCPFTSTMTAKRGCLLRYLSFLMVSLKINLIFKINFTLRLWLRLPSPLCNFLFLLHVACGEPNYIHQRREFEFHLLQNLSLTSLSGKKVSEALYRVGLGQVLDTIQEVLVNFEYSWSHSIPPSFFDRNPLHNIFRIFLTYTQSFETPTIYFFRHIYA